MNTNTHAPIDPLKCAVWWQPVHKPYGHRAHGSFSPRKPCTPISSKIWIRVRIDLSYFGWECNVGFGPLGPSRPLSAVCEAAPKRAQGSPGVPRVFRGGFFFLDHIPLFAFFTVQARWTFCALDGAGGSRSRPEMPIVPSPVVISAPGVRPLGRGVSQSGF